MTDPNIYTGESRSVVLNNGEIVIDGGGGDAVHNKFSNAREWEIKVTFASASSDSAFELTDLNVSDPTIPSVQFWTGFYTGTFA